MIKSSNKLSDFTLTVLSSPPIRIILIGFILIMMMTLNTDILNSYSKEPIKAFFHILALAISGFAVYLGYAYLIEQRTASELSLRGMRIELGYGLFLGIFLYSTCELILISIGIYRIEGFNTLNYMVPAIAMAISSSVYEELLFRGVLLSGLVAG